MLRSTIALAIIFTAQSAHAYSIPGWKWPNQAGDPVIFRIDPAGSADISDGSDLEAVRNAFQTWDEVTCSYLEFAEGDWMEPKVYQNDGVNRIFWVEGPNDWSDSSPSTIALTYTFYRTEDNIITDADMRINGVNWTFTTVQAEVGTGTPAKVDTETVVFHEVGHFLGLNHSRDPQAAMYASNNKPIMRGPAIDDIQGVCAIYSNGTAVPIPNPQEGVGAPCINDTDCQTALCAQDDANGGSRYCTAVCDATRPCPQGYECADTGQGSFCLLPIAPDELCDQCDQGAQCSTGFCTRVPNVNSELPFCSRPCDPTPGQPAQCPNGYSCQAVLGSDIGGACAPNTAVCEPKGKGAQNEPCFANGTCKSGFTCVPYYPDSGLNFCYFSCGVEFQGQSCTQGGGTVCAGLTDRDNAAACFTVSQEGQPCIPEVCDATSFCAFEPSLGIESSTCYRLCASTADCGANSQCTASDGLPNLCTPLEGFKYEGQACSSDAECRSRTCRTYGSSRLCTSVCSLNASTNECGHALKCLPSADSSTGLCWPENFTNAPPPTNRPEFCSCDTTSACDKNCECDPECTGGCGCTIAAGEEGNPGSELAVYAGFVALLAIRRRRY